MLDAVSVQSCDSLRLLQSIDEQWSKASKLLVHSSQRVYKFTDRLQSRIQELEEVEEASETVSKAKQEKPESGDVEMLAASAPKLKDDRRLKQEEDQDDADEDSDEFDFSELARFWDEHVETVIVDLGMNTDREMLEMQLIWLELTAREKPGSASRQFPTSSA